MRFPQRRKKELPFHEVLNSLRSSSQDTLDVMGLSGLSATTVSPEDVVSIIRSFLNLKEIDMDSFKIYLRDSDGSKLESFVPGADNPSLQVSIVQNWDPLRLKKPHGVMSEWWDHWEQAKQFMCEVWSVYLEQSRELELLPIRVQFMYPIKAFMSKQEATDYAERTGAWKSSERRALTVEDASDLLKEIRTGYLSLPRLRKD